MSRKQAVIEDDGPGVPAYIVTFSDMVTLLLTFFVMLLSLASVQDPGLFNKGRDSFVESIHNLGVGMLFGRRPRPDFGAPKIKDPLNDPNGLLDIRIIDAREAEIRELFDMVRRSMKAIPSEIITGTTEFSVTSVHFSPGQTTLDEAAKQFLTEFCLNLRQAAGAERVKLYVLGLANDEASAKEQWIVSAKRAQAAAEFLMDLSGDELGWHVYSWGAGAGGVWVGTDSPVSEQSQIMIAVLRGGD